MVLRPLRHADTDVSVTRTEDGGYQVHSIRAARWVQMLPLEDRDAVRYIQARLRRGGIEAALIDAGARTGDEVVIGDVVFDFDPELDDLPEEERLAVLAAEAAEAAREEAEARGDVLPDDVLEELEDDR